MSVRHPVSADPSWWVRPAVPQEAEAVAAAVAELLQELGARPPPAAAMEAAARTLIVEPAAGAVFVAAARAELVGVLVASWQVAIHAPGRYALIQDLWVHPAWRSHAVGSGLVEALVARVERERVGHIEVGLPRDRFPQLEATRRFYGRNGFDAVGMRMRRTLP
jgi:GNAT superfamily N-acetyltransferase